MVHRAVVSNSNGINVYTTLQENELDKYPIAREAYDDKVKIVNKFYSSERYILKDHDVWMQHEHLSLFDQGIVRDISSQIGKS